MNKLVVNKDILNMLIGKDREDAKTICENNGIKCRIVTTENGTPCMVTQDYNMARVNLENDATGKVMSIRMG